MNERLLKIKNMSGFETSEIYSVIGDIYWERGIANKPTNTVYDIGDYLEYLAGYVDDDAVIKKTPEKLLSEYQRDILEAMDRLGY